MLKKIIFSILVSASLSVQAQTIAVSQIIDHPALNDAYAGMQEALQAAGVKADYLYENAQGQGSVALQIAEKFAGENIDVAVGIGTPSAQALQSTLQGSKPLVFVAVTDPVAAKLVRDWNSTNENITGVSDTVPVTHNLKLMRDLLPQGKRLGTIYNTGEANSIAAVSALKEAAKDWGWDVVESAATKSSEVTDAVMALLGQVDALYIVQDNLVVSAMQTVVQLGEEYRLPVFAADAASVRTGAIASYSFDYRDVGRSAGEQIAALLNGQKTEALPVRTAAEIKLILNARSAAKMGLDLPEALRQQAHEVIQ